MKSHALRYENELRSGLGQTDKRLRDFSSSIICPLE